MQLSSTSSLIGLDVEHGNSFRGETVVGRYLREQVQGGCFQIKAPLDQALNSG